MTHWHLNRKLLYGLPRCRPATGADALSTAFSLMRDDMVSAELGLLPRTQAYSVEAGRLREIIANRST